VDRPIADVVSFADRLAERSAASARDEEVTAEAIEGEPADLAREAMLRRLSQLAGAGQAVGSVDDELAVLVYDSVNDLGSLAGVRGGGQPDGEARQLTFRGPDLTIEVESDAARRELVCQVVPPQPVSLELCHQHGSLDLGRDEFGTFYVPEIPSRTIRIRCVPLSGGAPTATSWVTL